MKQYLLFFPLLLLSLGTLTAQQQDWIIGTNVILRKSATRQSEELKRFQNLDQLTVIQVSDIREKMDNGEVCDGWGYPWVNVRDEKTKITGWIYGRFIYGEASSREEALTATLQGKTYTVVMADDYSQGPGDEEGLTGCETLSLIALQAEGERAPRFVDMGSFRHLNESRGYIDDKEHPQSQWMLFSSNDGYGMSPSALMAVTFEGKPALRLTIFIGYQEGQSENELTLQLQEGGHFEVVDFSKGEVVYPED